MAITDISNLYTPSRWGAAMRQRLPEVSRLFRSRAIDMNSEYSQYVQGEGTIYDLPFVKPYRGRSQVRSANAPAVAQAGSVSCLVPNTIGTGVMRAVRHARGEAWAWRNLAMEISGLDEVFGAVNGGFGQAAEIQGDPVGMFEQFLAEYWANDMQTTLILALKGIFANPLMLAEHVSDISVAAAPTAANRISIAAVVGAKALLGDQSDKLGVIVMHSLQKAKLTTDQLIIPCPCADGTMMDTIAGMEIIVDDNVEIIPGAVPKYAVYILGENAIAYAERQERTPLEVARDASCDVDSLYSRISFVLQPKGISWVGNLPGGEFPTDAQISIGTNWRRDYERKNVPIVKLVVN